MQPRGQQERTRDPGGMPIRLAGTEAGAGGRGCGYIAGMRNFSVSPTHLIRSCFARNPKRASLSDVRSDSRSPDSLPSRLHVHQQHERSDATLGPPRLSDDDVAPARRVLEATRTPARGSVDRRDFKDVVGREGHPLVRSSSRGAPIQQDNLPRLAGSTLSHPATLPPSPVPVNRIGMPGGRVRAYRTPRRRARAARRVGRDVPGAEAVVPASTAGCPSTHG